MRYTLTIALLTILVAGCASSPTIQQPAGQAPLSEISIAVEYFDSNRQEVSAEYQPKHVFLLFPHIPGQIFGAPTEQPIFVAPVAVGDKTVVDLENARGLLEKQALPLQAVTVTKGLTVSPPDTRFSRIGTFPHDARTSKAIGGGGFLDPASGDSLILMYFDRPCTITGDVVIDSGTTSHSIDIPTAGFHWIQARRISRERHELSRRDATRDAVFSIYLYHLRGS